MDISAGIYKAFLSLACPILHNLALPLIDDPDIVSFGANPMKATISRTCVNLSRLSNSARR
jgi:hypothetical protein